MPGHGASPRLHRHAPVEVAGDAAVLQPVAVVQPFLARSRWSGSASRSCCRSSRAARRASGCAAAGRGAWSRAPRDRSSRRSPSAGRSGRSGRAAWCSSRTGRRAPCHSRSSGRCPRCSGRAGSGCRRRKRPASPPLPRSARASAKASGEMLGQAVVARAGRAAEMVEGQAEAVGDVVLDLPCISAQ